MEDHKNNDAVLLEKINELQEDIAQLKAELKPITEAYSAAKNTGEFITWFSKVILALGVVIATIFGIKHIS